MQDRQGRHTTDTGGRSPRRASKRRLRRTIVVGGLTASLFVVAVPVHDSIPPDLRLPGAPDLLPWSVVAIFFLLAEVLLVRMQVRRESRYFSLSEIPLVVGLFFLSAQYLIVARLVGGGLGLAVNRRQPPMRTLFNLGHLWLGTCLAALVFHRVASTGVALGVAGWSAGFLAALTAFFVGDLARGLPRLLSADHPEWQATARGLAHGLVPTLANTVLGLAAVTILWSTPRASWLVLGLAAMFFFSYRAYTLQRQKHETLLRLQECTDVIRRSSTVEEAAVALVQQVRMMFRGKVVQLTLLTPKGGNGALCVTLDRGREPLIERRSAVTPAKTVIPYSNDAMVALMRAESEVIGAVMVADRVGDTDGFSSGDVNLFNTVVAQASLSLDNWRLEKSLAQVTRLEERLRHQAFHDPLTGLANRALFLDRVEHAMSQRDSARLAAIFLDLDDFKAVNDSLGHEAGDRLLAEAAARLRLCLRPGDTAARLGGDEFAILLEDIPDVEVATLIASRFGEEMKRPFELDGKEVLVRASVGIALNDVASSSQELLRNADVAMYRAKSAGETRYEMYEPDMGARALERIELQTELRQAVRDDAFVLHYAPVVDLETESIVGMEALLRWRHPSRGLLYPKTFLTLTEETGLIVPIGRQVLSEACRRAAQWRTEIAAVAELSVSVNLSERQLAQDELVDDVAQALGAAHLDATSLILEVTEQALMRDAETARSKLLSLKELGVRIALDDFGIAYSSLRHLRRFPLDILKIPKSFIDDLTGDEESAVLARAVMALASSLDLETVAEGIESTRQVSRLRQEGCRLGQGFVFARPSDAASSRELLAAASARPAERPEIAYPRVGLAPEMP